MGRVVYKVDKRFNLTLAMDRRRNGLLAGLSALSGALSFSLRTMLTGPLLLAMAMIFSPILSLEQDRR